jgi:NAD(P)-dependent dehydrogenase (short-subunit alcohol dehydrogenase family)
MIPKRRARRTHACTYPAEAIVLKPLANKVALVTGASRGAGRAVAAVLGEAGATVYVTGRTVRGGDAQPEGLPGTIDDTADEVTARGGTGIPVRCDHTRENDIQQLVDRIRAEQPALDILVNNVWGGYENHPAGLPMRPFWEQPPSQWQGMFVAGLQAHLLTAQRAAPLMLARPGGLVVSTIAWAYDEYLRNLFYDVSKAATIRMIQGMARDLKPHGVAAVAVAPGFMRTERILAAHAAHPFDLSWTEPPEYLGRAIRSLATDPDLMRRTGEVVTVGDLAVAYNFTDVDGRQPKPFRYPPAAAT